MEYTPTERLKQIWALAQSDQDCMACCAEIQEYERLMSEYTDRCPDSRQLWAFPVSIQIYFGRVLEVISRQMRFPGEQ